jgi:uncharacterized protein (TIGR02266 family)
VAATNPTSKRRQQRYDVQIPVEFSFDGQAYEGRSRNMSIGGMFVVTDAPLPFGAKITVSFHVPTLKEPVGVDSQVRWVERQGEDVTGVGVQFVGLRAKHVWGLNKFFEEQKPAD